MMEEEETSKSECESTTALHLNEESESEITESFDKIQIRETVESPDDRVPKKRKGKKGKKSELITNYVRVHITNPEGIHEYQVFFSPRIDNLEIRKGFLNKFSSILGESRIFDGIYLYLPYKLPDNVTVLRGLHPKNQTVELKVSIQYGSRKPHRELVQFFNILLRRVMTIIGKFEIKNCFFDRDIKFNIPQYKLQIWPGICTSVEEQENGLMLCLDTSYRVFRTDTVYDYYYALSDSSYAQEDFKSYILGKVVVTRYNNFTYRIDDIDWDRSPSSSFIFKGSETTYKDYYKSQYKLDIINPDQPLLVSRIKVKTGYRETEEVKIVFIIPELCFVAGIDPENRNNDNMKKELARHTFTTPVQKMKALKAFVERLNEIPEAMEVLSNWNVHIDNELLEVTGREISGPTLKFGSNIDLENAGPDFIEEVSQGVYEPIKQRRWLVICSQRDVKIVNRFVNMYKSQCGRLGISMACPGEIVTLKGASPSDFREALEDYADPESVHFVIIVMPYARREIYSVIKRICVSERPIPCQVVLSRTLTNDNNLMLTVRKLAMQINCKLGGSLWALSIPLAERIMFVGIDVNHDVNKVQPSVVALIASMNNTCTKYFSKVHIQKIHQEITDNMKPMFLEALECFREMNGEYPQRIIVFRDGGSMSAMKLLTEHEVKPMISAIDDLCPQLKNFTYCVVAKRVPQRFFANDRYKRILNPNPGTVIDSTVTYPGMFDFYVVSQRMCHRTIIPTHYMVIYDIGGIEPDLMQKFAYSTTFMYFNWSGTIRVPAMIQYAHKLSSLVGQYVRMDPSKKLETTLYYL